MQPLVALQHHQHVLGRPVFPDEGRGRSGREWGRGRDAASAPVRAPPSQAGARWPRVPTNNLRSIRSSPAISSVSVHERGPRLKEASQRLTRRPPSPTAPPWPPPAASPSATIATAIALAILFGLGVWQVQRLHWKEALLARIEARQAAPPGRWRPVLAGARPGEDLDFTRVSLAARAWRRRATSSSTRMRDGEAGLAPDLGLPAAGAATTPSWSTAASWPTRSRRGRPSTPSTRRRSPSPACCARPARPSARDAAPRTTARWYSRDVAGHGRRAGRPARAGALHAAPRPRPIRSGRR